MGRFLFALSRRSDRDLTFMVSKKEREGRGMSIQDNIRNALLSGGGFAAGPQKNTPPQYANRQKQYFGDVTEKFNAQYAKYAPDYMTGTLQYFDPSGDSVTTDVTFRFANVVRPTAAIQRYFDDYKIVLFDQLNMDYVQQGAKLTTNGSTWIAFNPDNISSVTPNAIFRRCNAVWNHLDFYGNVVSEPIIVEEDRANASTPDAQNSQMVSRGYYNVVCQYNDFTRQINDNTRLVLGSKTYEVTGYGDFSTEFTGDYSTVRILKFTIRVETKNMDTDDMVNHVAEGKTFSWECYISGPEEWGTEYGPAYYTAETVRNSKNIAPTSSNPYHYVWSVDDDDVAQIEPIGSDGLRLIALRSGAVIITATLYQNPEIVFQKTVKVEAAKDCVRFVKTAPTAPLEPYQNVELTVYDYDETGGVDTAAPINFTASGAAEGSYRMDITSNNTVSVTCLGYSETPLTVTAEYDGKTDSVQIELEGY